MIEEDYVSFETAKLLKEKGFKGQGEHFYEDNKITNYINYWFRITPEQRYEAIEAPTLQMTMKWLREEHHLYVWISYNFNHTGLPWYYEIFDIKNIKVVKIGGVECGSYEKTCEIAIEECLKNLI